MPKRCSEDLDARFASTNVDSLLPQGGDPSGIAAAGKSALAGVQDYFAERCSVPVACGIGYAASTAVYEGFVEDVLNGVDEFRDGNYGGAAVAAVFAVIKPAKLGK